MKLFHFSLIIFMLIVSWIYSDFFISLAAALGLAIQIAISFGYKASIDAYLEFATKDYVLHQLHDLALLKSNLNDKTLSLLVDVSTMALLVFPFALVYVILIFLRWLKVKRPLRVGNTETVTYLRDGSLNPKRKNVDRLSQQHPRKYNARREKVSAKKFPLGLVLWSIFVIFVSAYWLFSNRLLEIDKNLMGQTHKEIIKKEQNILEGRITHVRDGDTFEINGQAIRISALDCPENSTTEGQTVTQYAKQFKGKMARCELTGATTYDRVVGYCSIAGADFGKTMMDNTSCKVWKKYDVWDRY